MGISLEGARAGYGGIEVLHGIDLGVAAGEVFAVLGPNGAGKSTLLGVISGRLALTGGALAIDGRPVRKAQPERLARDGLCCIPEGRGIFPNLTVEEHLSLWAGGRLFGVRESKAVLTSAAFARFPVLAERRRQLAGSLSGGERQMLALSRALRPGVRAFLCDEVSMGLAPLVVEELYAFIASLPSAGVTVVVVEQFAEMALAVADRAAVLVEGKVRLAGTPDEVRAGLSAAYLGGD
jgi:branched-chain amino acid transport system ATP-binding protein